MNTLKNAMKMQLTLITLFFIFTLAACGGGDGGGGENGTDDGVELTDQESTTISLDNRVILYFVTTDPTDSSYFPNFDITIESNTQYIVRVFPDTLQAELLTSNYSPSYAPSNIFPYIVDDRIFIREEYRPFEKNGHHDLREYTVDGHQQLKTTFIYEPYYFADHCSAVVGNNYYFTSRRNSDFPNADVGGEFYVHSISSGTTGQLINYDDIQNCFGNLISENGRLYDVFKNGNGNNDFYLYERNQTTGTVVNPILNIKEDVNPQNYRNYIFTVSDGFFYTARRVIATNVIEIYRSDMAFPDASPVQIYSDTLTNFSPYRLEVDNGHLMLASYNGLVLLYDLSTNGEQLLDLGMDVAEIQQVYVDTASERI